MKKQSGKILLAGGSGMIGAILKNYLEKQDKEVHILSRRESSDPHVYLWDPVAHSIDKKITGQTFDVLINLCGAGIADKRWTSHRKKLLYDSRIIPTQFLWSSIKEGQLNTSRFIQISTSGFYGNKTNPVDEQGPSGSSEHFMVRLTKAWEKTFLENRLADVSQCRVRMGVVISSRGGFMERFLTPVRFFMAPYFGDGQNYISWIHESDLAEMFSVLIEKESLDAVYNCATTNPVTSKTFSKMLLKVFNSYAFSCPVPVWLLQLIFGKMKSAILADVQMMPSAFLNMGYKFHTPEMEDALKKVKANV